MRTVTRYLLLLCGWTAFTLGAIGAIFPVLPTTPFMLVAAACFLRSSERLHRWLLTHPKYGPQVRDYFAGKGLRRSTKWVAIGTMWASILASIAFFVPFFWIDLLLIVIAVSVTLYLVGLPTSE